MVFGWILPKETFLFERFNSFEGFKFASRNLARWFPPCFQVSATWRLTLFFALMYALTLRVDALALNQYRVFTWILHLSFDTVPAIHTSYIIVDIVYAIFFPIRVTERTEIMSERMHTRVRERKRERAEKERVAGSSGQHQERYRWIANKGITRSANNTGALSQSRGDP